MPKRHHCLSTHESAMARKRRRRSRKGRNNKNKWVWVGAIILALAIILIIDLKPWHKHHDTISDQWPFHDLTKGPYSKDFEGLDISRHQGKIHWDELVDENPQLQFVYIKATEGSSIVDPFYKRNFDEAKKHDLLVGSYHFLTRRTSMAKQVDNFLSNINLQAQDLLLLVDIEEDGTRGWSRSIIQKNLAEFIRLVKERTGVSPMIYTNEAYYHLNLYPEFNHYHLFIANYNLAPELGTAKYDIWQSSKRGRVRGIWNYVDINQLREGVTLEDIKQP